MKSALLYLSLFSAVAFSITLFAQFAGLDVIQPIDSLYMFAAFGASVALLIILSDYAPDRRSFLRQGASTTTSDKCVPFPTDREYQRIAA